MLALRINTTFGARLVITLAAREEPKLASFSSASCFSLRFLFMFRHKKKPSIPSTTNPPMTPPATGPVLLFFELPPLLLLELSALRLIHCGTGHDVQVWRLRLQICPVGQLQAVLGVEQTTQSRREIAEPKA